MPQEYNNQLVCEKCINKGTPEYKIGMLSIITPYPDNFTYAYNLCQQHLDIIRDYIKTKRPAIIEVDQKQSELK